LLASHTLCKSFNVIDKLAKVNTPVLIRGESGTGKELVARAIHYNGPRKDAKFVTINLAAVPENLIESDYLVMKKVPLQEQLKENLVNFNMPMVELFF